MNILILIIRLFFVICGVLWAFLSLASREYKRLENERAGLRFYHATTKAAKYIYYNRRRGCLTISNKKCILFYGDEIEIRDLSNHETQRITRTLDIDEILKKTIYREICNVFCEDTNYAHLYYILQSCGANMKERTAKVEFIQKEEEEKPKRKADYLKRIDINSASESELKSLPGINVIYAKKIIKRREEIGGFKNINELFEYLKLTPSMIRNLRHKIFAGEMKKDETKIKYNERNIDL